MSSSGGGAARVVLLDLRRQLLRSWPVLMIGAAMVIVVFAGAIAVMEAKHVSGALLTRDPNASTHSPWWLGAVSNLGLILWAAAAGACVVGAFVVRRAKRGSLVSPFLMASAAISAVLAVDDGLMLHEGLLHGRLGIPKIVSYSAYALAGGLYVAAFRKVWVKTDYVLMLAAIGCFGLSIVVDLAHVGIFLEDAFKFAGIVFWFLYTGRSAVLLLAAELAAAGAAAPVAGSSPGQVVVGRSGHALSPSRYLARSRLQR